MLSIAVSFGGKVKKNYFQDYGAYSHHRQLQPERWCRPQTDQSQSSLYWKQWPGVGDEDWIRIKLDCVFVVNVQTHCSVGVWLIYNLSYKSERHSHQRGLLLPWKHPGPVYWRRLLLSWRAAQLPVNAAAHWRPEPRWCLLLLTGSPRLNGPDCWCWAGESHLEMGTRSWDREVCKVYQFLRLESFIQNLLKSYIFSFSFPLSASSPHLHDTVP